MKDNIYIESNYIVIMVDEELDHHTATQIRKSTDNLMNTLEIDNVLFDFSNTKFMDSSGIGLIMGRLRRAKLTDGKVAVINMDDSIKRILHMSGIDNMVGIFSSKEDVWNYFKEEN